MKCEKCGQNIFFRLISMTIFLGMIQTILIYILLSYEKKNSMKEMLRFLSEMPLKKKLKKKKFDEISFRKVFAHFFIEFFFLNLKKKFKKKMLTFNEKKCSLINYIFRPKCSETYAQ